MLALLLASFQGYSLQRVPSLESGRPGFACIPSLHTDSILPPGAKAKLHVYDASSLQVLRHAQANANSIYGQCIVDEEAMRERRFDLRSLGSRVKVLGFSPSTKSDKFGGSSNSLIVDVIGIGICSTLASAVVEKMPFMKLDGESSEDVLPSEFACLGACSFVDDLKSELEKAAATCHDLEEVRSFMGGRMPTDDRVWSLGECAEQVIKLRGETPSAGSTLVLCALAGTAYLPGSVRLEAMELAHQGKGTECVELVSSALQEEASRRLAMKALAGIGSSK